MAGSDRSTAAAVPQTAPLGSDVQPMIPCVRPTAYEPLTWAIAAWLAQPRVHGRDLLLIRLYHRLLERDHLPVLSRR